MFNYVIIVDGRVSEENNFVPNQGILELCVSAFLLKPSLRDAKKIEVVITRQKD